MRPRCLQDFFAAYLLDFAACLRDFAAYVLQFAACLLDFAAYLLDFDACLLDFAAYLLNSATYLRDFAAYLQDFDACLLDFAAYLLDRLRCLPTELQCRPGILPPTYEISLPTSLDIAAYFQLTFAAYLLDATHRGGGSRSKLSFLVGSPKK